MAVNIYTKLTSYGIDKIIKSIQMHIQNNLTWQGEVDVYGKLQKTERENRLLYEFWTSNNEYKEVFIDDTKAGVIGFVVNNPRRINGYNIETEVDVIATVDLTKIFTNSRRDDERAINNLRRILETAQYVNGLIEIRDGINNVFNDISTDFIKYRDMQPYYVFSIKVNIKYNEDDC